MQRITTNIDNRFLISTNYRKASINENLYYYESMVWEYKEDMKTLGSIVYQTNSGLNFEDALNNHNDIVRTYSYIVHAALNNII